MEEEQEQRTLFIQFDHTVWTAESIQSMVDTVGNQTPDDVKVLAVPDNVEYLNESQVENFVSELSEVVDSD